MRPGAASAPRTGAGAPGPAGAGVLERLVRRDRAVVAVALAVLALLAWAYVVHLARDMHGAGMGAMDMEGMDMGAMAMPRMQAWSAHELALLFAMWAVMMAAMMLPSAAPMILMFAQVARRRQERGTPYAPTALFLLGYLLVWTGYSALATLAQWGLHRAALLSPMMVGTTPLFGGLLLVAAGLYQLTPLKHLCLTQCRSPLGFLTAEWREGARGALRMGVRHGAYCAGCCWVLMALLFVAGVMNLLWIAVIAGFVLLEKVVPRGEWVSRGAGVLLLAWGAWMLGVGFR